MDVQSIVTPFFNPTKIGRSDNGQLERKGGGDVF